MVLTSIRKAPAGPSASPTLGTAGTVAPRAASCRLHLNNISHVRMLSHFSCIFPTRARKRVGRYFSLALSRGRLFISRVCSARWRTFKSPVTVRKSRNFAINNPANKTRRGGVAANSLSVAKRTTSPTTATKNTPSYVLHSERKMFVSIFIRRITINCGEFPGGTLP